jgi:hypothetical protein
MQNNTEVLEPDPLTEFFDAIKNPLTKNSYTKRLTLFFNHLKLEGSFKDQARQFAKKAKQDPAWATVQINEYMRMQKLRASNTDERGSPKLKEIEESTLPNYYKPIKLFCEQNDIVLNWKKISRRIPRGRQAADDRIPTTQEIIRLLKNCDSRVKIAVLIMLSSGCRIGALADPQDKKKGINYGHIERIEKNGELIAAKVTFYPGTDSKYVSFITPEAYRAVQEYIDFRKAQGEKITKDSPLLRDLIPPEKAARGVASRPNRFGYNPLRNQVYSAFVTAGLRPERLPEGKKRHEFEADHAFRKFFTTICLKHIKPFDVYTMRGDNTGFMGESYNRPTDEYLLGEYLKAIPELTILEPQVQNVNLEDIESLKRGLEEANKKIAELQKEKTEQSNQDADTLRTVLKGIFGSEEKAKEYLDKKIKEYLGDLKE